MPGVHILDAFEWTQDCAGFDDDKHHSKAAIDHALVFLAHQCSPVLELVQEHCPQLCPFIDQIDARRFEA